MQSPFLLFLRNVAAYLITLQPLQHRAAMVALVGHHLFDTVNVDLGFVLGPLFSGAACMAMPGDG